MYLTTCNLWDKGQPSYLDIAPSSLTLADIELEVKSLQIGKQQQYVNADNSRSCLPQPASLGFTIMLNGVNATNCACIYICVEWLPVFFIYFCKFLFYCIHLNFHLFIYYNYFVVFIVMVIMPDFFFWAKYDICYLWFYMGSWKGYWLGFHEMLGSCSQPAKSPAHNSQ